MEKKFIPKFTQYRIPEVSDGRRQEIADIVGFWKYVGDSENEKTLKERDNEIEALHWVEQIILIDEMQKQGVKADWLGNVRSRMKFTTYSFNEY